MTTTTQRANARTTKDQRDETLAEFSSAVDAHLGRPAGFARAVADLADVRARIKRIEERRSSIYRELEQRHRARGGGPVLVPSSRGGEPWVLRRTNAKVSVTRTVPAEIAKKADRAVYEAARVAKAKLRLVPPPLWRGSGDVDKLPALPNPGTDTGAVIALYRAKQFDVLAELRQLEDDARLALDKIAADCGWDGGETNGPILFADGWEIGLRTREYSADRLREIDPALFDRLAVTKERAAGTRIMVVGLEQAFALGYVTEEDLEADEIDGE
ncbi:hypothetical protein SEA_FUNSIZED_66 [Mycobacterium phage Funsized]|nr:hypothetical protein SEA_FUNSIZED_66 [Mycobacterium phage Funsized]